MNQHPLLATAMARAALWFQNNPSGWTKGALARDRGGSRIDPLSPSATCFCEVGRVAVELVALDPKLRRNINSSAYMVVNTLDQRSRTSRKKSLGEVMTRFNDSLVNSKGAAAKAANHLLRLMRYQK